MPVHVRICQMFAEGCSSVALYMCPQWTKRVWNFSRSESCAAEGAPLLVEQ